MSSGIHRFGFPQHLRCYGQWTSLVDILLSHQSQSGYSWLPMFKDAAKNCFVFVHELDC